MIGETTEAQAVADAFREVELWVQSYISDPFYLTVRVVHDGIVRYTIEVEGREMDANMVAYPDAAKVAHTLMSELTYALSESLCTLDAGELYKEWRLNAPCGSRPADELTCEVAARVMRAVESEMDYCRALLHAVDALKSFGTQGNA